MEYIVLVLLLIVFLIVGGTLGGIYFYNRDLVKVPKRKMKKKDKKYWSLEG
jgi:uncharacterized protein YneF (UPF0154 family)